jgi:TM2 domain-containing membrane protein YozV
MRSAGQSRRHREPRNALVATFLAIVGGGLGLHSFYLRRPLRGIAQASLTVLAVWQFGLVGLLAAAWGVFEGIRILHGKDRIDGKRIPIAQP